MDFLVPTSVPQDLLLIHDILGPLETKESTPTLKREEEEEDIASSGDEASEAEIHAELVKLEEDSESELSSDSESDSEDEAEPKEKQQTKEDVEDDVDEVESGAAAPPALSYFQTKNELLETDITVPDIEQVGPEEALEHVGEVFSVVDKSVIVKGASSSPHTLDSDTLLVFEDRKVLGYIYETFGPTTQPLYQVKFNAAYPVDPEKITLSRAVFHVPQRSKFVEVDQIKRFKGSDASNVNDEEPAAHELDFSDDEAEAEHKRRMKNSSRAGTPSPAQMRDQEMAYYESNPYAENSAYDDDYGAGPSRPTPLPYDDPYSEDYTPPPLAQQHPLPAPPQLPVLDDMFSARARGRGRGGRDGSRRGRDRGRGRGRGGRPDWDHGNGSQPPQRSRSQRSRSLSPTSLAIARATGQYPQDRQQPPSWAAPPMQQQQFSYNQGPMPMQMPMQMQQGFVQPHINPRFASAFGFGVMPQAGQQQQPPYYYPQQQQQNGGAGDGWTQWGNS
ncbi:ACT-7 domain-containing protein [Mycena chlorophos]|uniref:H/ACA ribonucleoprotein complex non-core subunit NAF1 n=1 Tax=Mycena chlorophos TaxID=658473 RepID=A0A8H6W5R0_MYCCL|nr:ACT-7 domain-containing protein [Mycena chlorophos]